MSRLDPLPRFVSKIHHAMQFLLDRAESCQGVMLSKCAYNAHFWAEGHQAPGSANLLLVFLVRTFVIAWRITMPAFSISFFDSPDVALIFNAG